ncbi:MBL fold metallo-hydrolase [Gaoshiqia sp. Z1-71]|uniref:MBL fold metallo-hydrolase n=1 Tax=Gaoshiqia hydrogeniformans TaxID=3290090 RepID=UPI003BF8C0D7
MRLTILTENTAGGRFLAEHGLSYLVELDGRTILFDTGHSDVFIQNALKLNIDLQKTVDLIVLSHGHWDHGDGLRFLEDKPLLAHPAAFMQRFRKSDGTSVGLSLTKEMVSQKFDLMTTAEPYRISEHIFFLGEVARKNDFEAQSTSFCDENGDDDFVPDDSALVLVENGQLIIISGCAHSGICNICEQAKKVTGIRTINAVLGGFHLKQNNKQTCQTIRYFRHEKVRNLIPSHCTGLQALSAFHEAFHTRLLKTGQQLTL